jgi:hypothetical protein
MADIKLLEPADGAVTGPLQEHLLHSEDETDETDIGAVERYAWDNLQIVSTDRSMPKAVHLEWEKVRRGLRSGVYRVVLSTSPDLEQDSIVMKGLTKPGADVWHLFLGVTYYWKVTASVGKEIVSESPIGSFTTNSLPPRWIKVSGITNVRDLGGWPLPGGRRVRQGLAYRSSEMNGHLQITDRGKHMLEDELRIRTDLDLRGEYDGAGSALDPDKVQWVNTPISPYDCITDLTFKEGYRQIFEIFADRANYPILFHCVGGADRGGTVAFLLNGLLGKTREHLMRDYELTTLSVWGERSRSSEQFLAMMDALRPFGDGEEDPALEVENYAYSLGVSRETVSAIRDILIEHE